MKILLLGASGFIGSHLRQALLRHGHRLVLAGRRPAPDIGAAETWLELDLARPPPTDRLALALHGTDAVVNAAGAIRDRRGQTLDALHADGPRALFDAALAAGVGRVVQVSALGADAGAQTRFHRSKRAADAHLLGLPLAGVVAQPSLVFGPGGASARLFLQLASWPLLVLPAGGRQLVQPIHIDDVVDALVALVERRETCGTIALVGPEALLLRDYLQALRAGMDLRPAPVLAVPTALVGMVARLGDLAPSSLLDSERWQMLQRGNAAPAGPLTRLLGRPPRPVQAFVPSDAADAMRTEAQVQALLPLLRLSVALVWIVTGIVSLGVYPVEQSYELLARSGVPAALQPLALYGAALLDLALGVATLAALPARWRQRLWLGQIVLIGAYTAIISVRLPEFWLHPYGPILKNLPMLALLLLLLVLDSPRKEQRRGL
jgi:uncharacterized protein YbjT (DUF2867 family)/uncharacterized membrane protein YphA (DoxX/SURF4 family)